MISSYGSCCDLRVGSDNVNQSNLRVVESSSLIVVGDLSLKAVVNSDWITAVSSAQTAAVSSDLKVVES